MSWYNGKRYQQRSSKLRAQNLHERNVKSAQENTQKREAAEGEAYAKKAQADYTRGKRAKQQQQMAKQAQAGHEHFQKTFQETARKAVKNTQDSRGRILEAMQKSTGSAYGDKMRSDYNRQKVKSLTRK